MTSKFKYTYSLNTSINSPYCYSPKYFTKNECDNIIDYALKSEKNNLVDAKVENSDGGSEINSYRISRISFIPSNDSNISWVFSKITEAINSLNEQFFQFDVNQIETLQFSVYDAKVGGHYGRHVDIMNTKNETTRKLSGSIQLSSPYSYEGGNLEFIVKKEADVLPREQGTLILFPSYVMHEVKPVTKGVRYSLVFWVTGPPFK
tara:strand:- start:81 stop:695 length:615 start_codon:yes stop_codon:yes gene_type:complete